MAWPLTDGVVFSVFHGLLSVCFQTALISQLADIKEINTRHKPNFYQALTMGFKKIQFDYLHAGHL